MKDGVDGFDVKNHFEKLFTEVVDDNPAATKVVLGCFFFRGGELSCLNWARCPRFFLILLA